VSNPETTTLKTGVLNLDQVLGGGIPEGDLLFVVGPPGSGKTTLVFQIAYHAASRGDNVVYVSTLAEPAARLLTHLRPFSFWDERLLGKRVFLESIDPVVRHGIAELARALVHTAKAHAARMIVIDGFMTIRDLHPDPVALRTFLSELTVPLAPLRCSIVITGSNPPNLSTATAPEFTMCDGIVELGQHDGGAATSRTLRCRKMRGANNLLGEHALQITSDGLIVYPRVETLPIPAAVEVKRERLSVGTAELDAMMGGGIPRGSVTIVAGAPGTGKTLVGLQYLIDGARRGEKGLMVGFRESPPQLAAKARRFNLDLEGPVAQGLVTIVRRVPVDLEINQLIWRTLDDLDRTGSVRLVIDSVAVLERLVTDECRRHDVMAALTESVRTRGVTTVLVRETSQRVGPELDFADSPLEVLAENVILLRYVEYEQELARIISVLKMRDAQHDHTIRQYDVEGEGFRVLPMTESRQGILAGIARLPSERRVKRGKGNSDPEDLGT
jgi:circadian clock protein KaiC